jgi:WD40 repeat protein
MWINSYTWLNSRQILFFADGQARLIDVSSSETSIVPCLSYGRWSVSPDGTQVANITSNAQEDVHPNNNVTTELNIVELDCSKQIPIVQNKDYICDAEWSPNGKQLLFVSGNSEVAGCSQLHLVNNDGTGLVRLDAADGGSKNSLTWSPHGQRLAFARAWGGIFVMNSDGSNLIQLANIYDENTPSLTWSPEGDKLAFNSYDNGRSAIYIYSFDDV